MGFGSLGFRVQFQGQQAFPVSIRILGSALRSLLIFRLHRRFYTVAEPSSNYPIANLRQGQEDDVDNPMLSNSRDLMKKRLSLSTTVVSTVTSRAEGMRGMLMPMRVIRMHSSSFLKQDTVRPHEKPFKTL